MACEKYQQSRLPHAWNPAYSPLTAVDGVSFALEYGEAVAFGLATAIFGNSSRLATLIATGQLDYSRSLPKNVLLRGPPLL
jgi:hypothetical protein